MSSPSHKPQTLAPMVPYGRIGGPGTSVAGAFRALVVRFRGVGAPTPELDARLLICAACELSHEQFVADPGRPLGADEAGRLAALTKRRLRREPVSRVLARRAFWGADFELDGATLDPRPETETLVQAALDLLAEKPERSAPPTILDLGTGSGCILLCLLMELGEATGVGTDLSHSALQIARRNAARLGVGARARFLCADWLDGLGGSFELVVANPPYVRRSAIPGLAPEVALYDPLRALDGGTDGLHAFRAIAARLRDVMAPGGWLVFEVGQGQSDAVAKILVETGLLAEGGACRRYEDLAGIVRCVAAPVD